MLSFIKYVVSVIAICVAILAAVCFGILFFIDSIYTQRNSGEVTELSQIPKVGKHFTGIKSDIPLSYVEESDKACFIYVAGFLNRNTYEQLIAKLEVEAFPRESSENYSINLHHFANPPVSDLNFEKNDLTSHSTHEKIGIIQVEYRLKDGLLYMCINYRQPPE